MAHDKDTGKEGRRHPRLSFSPDQRLKMTVGIYTFEVIDISKRGIRFSNPDKVKLADWIGATITLHDRSSLAIEGKIIWTDDHLLGMQLLNPISYEHLLNEQCYLIQEGLPRNKSRDVAEASKAKDELRIYLVQHGEPVPKEVNPNKPLSDKGRYDVEKVARFLHQAGVSVGVIVHSGKPRAEQTAALLGSMVPAQQGVVKKGGLSPNDAVEPVLVELLGASEDIMVVGHLPFLARLVRTLLGSDEDQEPIAFQQGGVVCLARGDDYKWRVEWIVVPKLLP